MVHNGHVEIRWVLELRASQLKISRKVLVGIIRFSLVDDLPLDHEEKVVEERVDLGVGLMDGQEDCLARPCEVPELVDDDEGGQGIHA